MRIREEFDSTSDLVSRVSKIETFYTGGGFWVTCAKIKDSDYYYSIDNMYPDCLNLFDRSKEDLDEEFPLQDFEDTKNVVDLNNSEFALWKLMVKDLKKTCEESADESEQPDFSFNDYDSYQDITKKEWNALMALTNVAELKEFIKWLKKKHNLR